MCLTRRAKDEGRPLAPGVGGWKSSLLLGIALTLIYSANRREIGAGDTAAAKFLPIAIIRGDGLYLDRFSQQLQGSNWDKARYSKGELIYAVTSSRGHIVSTYPVGPALLAVPFVLPQVLSLDLRHPGWDRDEASSWRFKFIAKNTAAVIAALTGVVLLESLRRLGLGRVALLTVLAVALGSNLWVVASQTLWQHGPAALALTLAMALLISRPVSRPRLVLAGLATAMLVACRPTALIFAAAITLWMAWHHPRDLPWFLLLSVPCGVALASYNYWAFGTIGGGYGGATWMTSPRAMVEGMVGTLLSPNRGLFIFCPWVPLALATIPAVAEKLRRQSLVCWLLWAIVPHFVTISIWPMWWAGHSFGPRFWTEVFPLFAIPLGFGLEWSWSHCRPVFWAFAATIVYSVGVQLIGALCYESTWNSQPISVDLRTERLWDWRDTELSRCLREGIKWRPRSGRKNKIGSNRNGSGPLLDCKQPIEGEKTGQHAAVDGGSGV